MKRLDWRDPNMPVWRNYIMPNGTRKEYIEPEYERRFREFRMSQLGPPSWRDDPTYNMKKEPK